MTTTLTFRKRVPKKRREAILAAVNPKYRPRLTDTALTIVHRQRSMAPLHLYLALWRDFSAIA